MATQWGAEVPTFWNQQHAYGSTTHSALSHNGLDGSQSSMRFFLKPQCLSYHCCRRRVILVCKFNSTFSTSCPLVDTSSTKCCSHVWPGPAWQSRICALGSTQPMCVLTCFLWKGSGWNVRPYGSSTNSGKTECGEAGKRSFTPVWWACCAHRLYCRQH